MKINFYLGFNNYYNREVKKFDYIADYQEYLIYTVDNVNFKPNDGINTTQKVNTTQVIDYTPFMLENTPDYAIVCEDDNTIVSRWFVMQFERLRAGQYEATLRRDVIADNFESIIEAPCFIEKATITDRNDVAIFNNENMGFNQIKTSETLLKDRSNIGWVVGYIPTTFGETPQTITVKYNGYNYSITPLVTGNIPNMPFKMFCLPYGNITAYFGDEFLNHYEFTTNKELAIAFAQGIAASIGSGNVFDIQLLPYCPLRKDLNGTGVYSLLFSPDVVGDYIGKYSLANMSGEYDLIRKEGDNNVTHSEQVIFWCYNNVFNFDILKDISYPNNAIDVKLENECDMWRLCSPNFQGQFEFNAMKNGGVTKFNVDCMYQPFNPYIHINPDFGKLYGSDYDDARGLICGGDFSLPQETNAWANYQQNNKNFQASFDRQILNMETMNRYQRISQYASAGVGTLQGIATGAFIGSGIAPGVGTVVGGAIGGVASAAGGITDTIMLGLQQKETLDYTKDQFEFNMQNIKAMPNSVSKSNPITNNNKIFPVLEYYTCDDKEKQALKDKMTYNGMTIGRIGKISEWLLPEYSYIKAKLIKIDSDICEDYHMVVEIAQELDKGIRAKKEE